MNEISSDYYSQKFSNNLELALGKLAVLPQNEKTDELTAPLYLHKNFLIRKILRDRIKVAYGMVKFKDKIVLDYGCGSGIFLQAISDEISKGIGVDLDTEIAKKIVTSKNIVLNQINNEKDIANFSNIDIISSFDVLEHIPNLDPLLEIFKKILIPSGTIIISGPTENLLYKLGRRIARIGLKGNILGEKEHVTTILDIKNKMINKGFITTKNVNLWNLFHVICFCLK